MPQNKANEADLWLALFNAETEDELNALSKNGGDIMSQAIGAYREITAEDEFRNLERIRAKRRHDEAQALNNAMRHATRTADEKWQGIVEEQARIIAELRSRLGETSDNE